MSEKYGTTSGNELESELKQVIVTASRSEFHFMSKIISENSNIWVKAVLWKTAFKKFEKIWSAWHFKLFKSCLPQILLSSFLNTLTHMWLCDICDNDNHEARQQFNKEAFESLVKIIKHYSSMQKHNLKLGWNDKYLFDYWALSSKRAYCWTAQNFIIL